jgi:hypothetical protein
MRHTIPGRDGEDKYAECVAQCEMTGWRDTALYALPAQVNCLQRRKLTRLSWILHIDKPHAMRLAFDTRSQRS